MSQRTLLLLLAIGLTALVVTFTSAGIAIGRGMAVCHSLSEDSPPHDCKYKDHRWFMK
jgi:hypothetical protein